MVFYMFKVKCRELQHDDARKKTFTRRQEKIHRVTMTPRVNVTMSLTLGYTE